MGTSENSLVQVSKVNTSLQLRKNLSIEPERRISLRSGLVKDTNSESRSGSADVNGPCSSITAVNFLQLMKRRA